MEHTVAYDEVEWPKRQVTDPDYAHVSRIETVCNQQGSTTAGISHILSLLQPSHWLLFS